MVSLGCSIRDQSNNAINPSELVSSFGMSLGCNVLRLEGLNKVTRMNVDATNLRNGYFQCNAKVQLLGNFNFVGYYENDKGVTNIQSSLNGFTIKGLPVDFTRAYYYSYESTKFVKIDLATPAKNAIIVLFY